MSNDYSNVTFGGYPQASGSHPWYSPINAFDGFLDSYWQSNTFCSSLNPAWISYHWESESFKIAKYRIHVNETQRPSSWLFQSSEDGINWITLNEQTNQIGEIPEWLEFEVFSNQYFNYFRLLITESTSPYLPLKINEIEFISILQDITTTTVTTTQSTTTVSSTSTDSTTVSSSSVTSSETTTGTTWTTNTTLSTTTTEDPTHLWKAQTKLNIVREQINQWYKTGIPIGIKQVDSLPLFQSSYISIPIYVTSEDKFYLGTEKGWELLLLGNVKHAPHHATDGDDELIHVGTDYPLQEFPGKLWVFGDYDITTTTVTTTQPPTTTTQTTTTTQSTTSTITYTYTTTTVTTTVTSTQSTTTITQSNYTYNILPGSFVSADSYELGYEPVKAIDNLDWTKWTTNALSTQNNFPHWIKFTLSEPKIAYVIDIFWDFARYATNWYLEGSNDGFIWDILLSKDNYIPVPNLYNQYTFSNDKAFSQYRIRFIDGIDLRTSSIGIYGVRLLADLYQTTSSTTATTTLTSTLSTTTSETTTASTTQLGYFNIANTSIVVGIDEYPYYTVNNLIDDNEYSYWICDPYVGPPYWIMFYWPHGESYVVNQYKLFMSTLGRPRDWKLQASLDGVGWVNLDTRYEEETEGWWESTISNSVAYKYYRFVIDETQSTGYSVRLGCIQLWINEEYRTSTTTTQTSTVTTTFSTTITTSTQTTQSTSTATTTYPIPFEMTMLMNFNGTDLATQSIDNTTRHRNIEWFGGAIIRTLDKKYGTGALTLPYESYYPSSLVDNSYLSFSNSYDWRLGLGTFDFSVDFWVKWNSDNNLYRVWNNIISYVKDTNNYWAIRYYPEGTLLNFTLRIDGILKINYNTLCTMIPNQWNYICLSRLGTMFKFFLNGSEIDYGQTNYGIEFPYFNTGNLFIGYGPSEYLNTMFDYTQANCKIDSIRINIGAIFNAPHELPPEPTTSTTVSTTTVTSTSTTSPLTYSPRLSLRCDDGESYIYDYTGRHGIISLANTNTTFTERFAVYTDQYITPKFGNYLLSGYTNPYDYRSSEAGYLISGDSDDWKLGDDGLGDFSIEMWMACRHPFNSSGVPILSQFQDLNNFWAIYVNYSGNKFNFKVRQNGVNIVDYISNINYEALDWNYFSLVRWNRKIKVFWNGDISSYWINFDVEIPDFTGSLYLCGGPSLSDFTQLIPGGIACNGVRICKGIYPGSDLGVIPGTPL